MSIFLQNLHKIKMAVLKGKLDIHMYFTENAQQQLPTF